MNWYGRLFRSGKPSDLLSESEDYSNQLAQQVGEWVTTSDQLLEEAVLVTSALHQSGLLHAPVIDLDIEHEYYPTSTPGHAALLLNVSLTPAQHDLLLDTLLECGIIQKGFREAARKRGYASMRPPWVKKEPKP
jgi:hypothetical protein